MPGQVFEIDCEMAAAQEGAHNAQHGGQRQGQVIVCSENPDKLESGDVTSIMRSGERVSKHCGVQRVPINSQYVVIRKCIEGRTR